MSDFDSDLLVSDVNKGEYLPIPPSGCWRLNTPTKRSFLIYVGVHEKAPGWEEIDPTAETATFTEEEWFLRRDEAMACEEAEQQLGRVSRDESIRRFKELQKEELRRRAGEERWRGPPAWFKERFPDPETRNAHWRRTLMDAGILDGDIDEGNSRSETSAVSEPVEAFALTFDPEDQEVIASAAADLLQRVEHSLPKVPWLSNAGQREAFYKIHQMVWSAARELDADSDAMNAIVFWALTMLYENKRSMRLAVASIRNWGGAELFPVAYSFVQWIGQNSDLREFVAAEFKKWR